MAIEKVLLYTSGNNTAESITGISGTSESVIHLCHRLSHCDCDSGVSPVTGSPVSEVLVLVENQAVGKHHIKSRV
jgi:hypothetical protein